MKKYKENEIISISKYQLYKLLNHYKDGESEENMRLNHASIDNRRRKNEFIVENEMDFMLFFV